MKTRSRNAERERAYQLCAEYAVDNLKVVFVVLHEQFGFGKDRLKKLMDEMQKKFDYYHEYDSEGCFKYAMDRDIHGLGLDDEVDYALTGRLGSWAECRQPKPKQTSVTVAEAAEMQTKMLAMTDLQKATGYDLGRGVKNE